MSLGQRKFVLRRQLGFFEFFSRIPGIRLISATLAIVVSFMIYSYLQEKIMTTPYRPNDEFSAEVFKNSVFLVLCNRIFGIIFALVAILFSGELPNLKPTAPIWMYFVISLSNVFAAACQYEALKWVSMPTQTIFKCTKMIPVMLWSSFFSRFPSGSGVDLSDLWNKLLGKNRSHCTTSDSLWNEITLSSQRDNEPRDPLQEKVPANLRSMNQPTDKSNATATSASNNSSNEITCLEDLQPVDPFQEPANTVIQKQDSETRNKDKSYGPLDYVCALAVAIGCATFLISGRIASKKSQNHREQQDTLWGIGYMIAFLCFDGFTSVFQEKLFRGYDMTFLNQMLYVNISSAIISLLISANKIETSIQFLLTHTSIIPDIIVLSVSAVSGQTAIFYTIDAFGALLCATVMTIRQFLSVLVSNIAFGHSMTYSQWFGVCLVFVALLARSYLK